MAALAGIGCLAFAGSALGVSPPVGLSSDPAGASRADFWTFTWQAPADAAADVEYVGGPAVTAGEEPSAPVVSGQSISVPEDARFFLVAAVDVSGRSDYAPLAILPDRTAPTLILGLQPAEPNGLNGWYRSLRISRSCADGGSGVVTPCGPVDWTQDSPSASYTYEVSDGVGLSSGPKSTPEFKFDSTGPTAGNLSLPANESLVGDEPTFSWTPGSDATSLVLRYELQYQNVELENPSWETIARVDDRGGIGDYSARRDPALLPEPLPEKTELEWRVRTFDRAGNVSSSGPPRRLRIDRTIPPAPTITLGPSAPTRIASPTFSWVGQGQFYRWDITAAGQSRALVESGGPSTTVTLPPLPDGSYTFRVYGVTEDGRRSDEATRSFTIDTTPPAPPNILVRPSFPAVTPPIFTWATEAGAYSRWTVLDAAGGTVTPPTDTPAVSATLPALADGPYSFQVQQIDPAGNVSAPTIESFTVLAPLAPAAQATVLPRQNATRLRPKAGLTVPTRSPVLRWTRGPRGTKLYNLQVFRVVKRRGTAPKIRKVLSVFPRGLQMRAPRAKLTPGTCYVWRVWPYTGRAFTPKPVGVSNFCVASSKVIKLKQKQARARKIAAARAARR